MTTHTCAQCGRTGTRGFKTLGPIYVDWLQHKGVEPFWTPIVVTCANEVACRKRWPRITDDQMERMYG